MSGTPQTDAQILDSNGNVLTQQYYDATLKKFAAMGAVPTTTASTVGMAALGFTQQITGYGTARVSGEPGSLLNETFETTLDTNMWLATGTVPPTASGGALVLGGGTTNSATSILTSVPVFTPTAGFTLAGCTVQFDAAKVATQNQNMTFGFAVAASPTASAPVDNGYVWERDIGGDLNCCVFVSGTRYCINSTNLANITASATIQAAFPGATASPLSLTGAALAWPAGNQTLLIAQRGDFCFWYLNSFDVPVAVSRYIAPAQQALPIRIAKINAAASVLATVNTFSALLVADSASQNQTLSDSTYPFRRQVVAANGGASVTSPGKLAKTYSCSFNVAPAASATDIAVISGNATTTTYVTRVVISATQTTAGLADTLLIKRSTADTGGTSSAPAIVAHDSTDAAASSIVLSYSVNPGALGTAVGTIRRGFLPVAGATSVVNPIVVFDFGDKGKEIVLRGVAQQLAVNLNGVTLTGGSFDINIEWFEV